MKSWNRIWSFLLTLSLVCSLFVIAPAAGFAAEDIDAAVFNGERPLDITGEDEAEAEQSTGVEEAGEIQSFGDMDEGEASFTPVAEDGAGVPLIPLAVGDVSDAAGLKAALAAGTAAITLQDNIPDYKEGVVINGGSVAIDLNGKNLSITNTKGPGLRVTNRGELSFSGSGRVDVKGKDFGVYLVDGTVSAAPSAIVNVAATGAGSVGLLAQSGAEATITGYISANASGISAQGTGTEVRVGGDVSATAKNASGVRAGAGSTVIVSGTRVSATGTGGVGARADGGKIIINQDIWAAGTGAVAAAGGEITCGSIVGKTGGSSKPSAYIKIENKTKKPADTVLTTKAGCKTYTDGTSTVWVSDTKKQGCEYVNSAGSISSALIAIQTKDHDHEGYGIVLVGPITTGLAEISIKNNSDVLIDLNGYNLTCDSLNITSGSLSVVDSRGGGGVFTVTKSITLDKGVFITPGYGGQPRVDVAAGGSATEEDIILAKNGSFVDIKGALETTASISNGIDAKSASTVKLEGSVSADYDGIRAYGKGTVVEVTGDARSTALDEEFSAGVRAEDYAKVTVGGDVNGNSGDGVNASGGSSITLTSGGVPISAIEIGIYAMGPGTTVKVQGGIGIVGLNPKYGIYAKDGAYVSVDASMASGGSGTVTGTKYGAYAEGSGTFIYVKPGATGSLHARDDGGCIAFAEEGGEIHVAGDLKTGTSGSFSGAEAYSGGKITVDGKITVSSGDYIVVDSGIKNSGNKTEPTTKPGYYTYSDPNTGSTVWVNANYVCRAGDVYYESLQGAINAIPSGGTGTITLLKDPEIYTDAFNGNAIEVQRRTVTIDLNGFNLTAISNNGYGLSLEGAALTLDNSGSGGKRADIRGYYAGITLQGSSGRDSNLFLSERFQAGSNTLDTVGDFRGLYVNEGCAATITSVTSIIYGVDATGSGASATVSGDVTADGSTTGTGVRVSDGAVVTVGGDVTGVGYGAYATDSGSMLTIGGSVMAQGSSTSTGVAAYNGAVIIVGCDVVALLDGFSEGATAVNGGTIEVGGDVFGGFRGVLAVSTASGIPTSVNVHGKAISTCYGAAAHYENSSVTVGGVIIYPLSTVTYGAYAEDKGSIVVSGDIITDTPATTSYGAFAHSGSNIIVNGVIVGNTTNHYASVGDVSRKKSEDSTHTFQSLEKPGYLTYTDDGTNVVWVKEEGGAPVIATPGGPLRSGKMGDIYSAYFAAATDGGDVTWKVHSGALPPGLELYEEYGFIFGMPTAPGLYSFSLTVEDDNGISAPVSFSIEIANAVNPLTISPTHAILTNTTDWAHFEVSMNIPNPNYANIDWFYPDWIAFEQDYDPGTRDYSIRLKPAGLVPGTFTVVASYNDIYSGEPMYEATATIEVIPGGIDANTTAKVLETKVTVNKAKEIGALVPVLITDQKPHDMGISAFSVGSGSSEPQTGSRIARTVELYTQNSKSKAWDVPLAGYAANMYGADQRYIEINADASVKNNKAVKAKVILRSSDGLTGLDAGVISLTAVENWPKFSVKAGDLNLSLQQNTAPLTVKAADGSKCFVNGITPPAGKDYFKYEAGGLRLKTEAKKGTFKTAVNISVTGYKTVPANKMPKVNIKIIDIAPKVKLAQSSVTLLRAEDFVGPVGSAAIGLVTADKKVPFESNYKVKKVSSGKADIDVVYENGVIFVTPKLNCKSGKAPLTVEFEGANGTKKLTLNINVRKKQDLKPASKVKSVTVNRETRDDPLGNFIADIPISLGADNFSANDWSITPSHGTVTAGILDGAILFVNGDNKLTLRLDSLFEFLTLLEANGYRDVKYKLSIKPAPSTGLPNKSFSLNLTLTEKEITGKISTKGKIDVANPASAVTASLTLKNTSMKIASVDLYKFGTSIPSGDFKVIGISGNTFKIVAAHKEVVPGVQQTLKAVVTLTNSDGTISDIKVKVKPVQGKGKATQSLKAVTLYKSTPMQGSDTIRLDLTKPANAKLGVVSVNQASLKAMRFPEGGFCLEQNGLNHYSIRFEDGRAPAVFDKTGMLGKFKKSYTLKLDIWAEGTYKWSGDRPVALDGGGKAMTKPTTVKIKVNIK